MVTKLNRHIRDIHLREKRHQCLLCGKKFSQRSSVKRHLMNVHKDKIEEEEEEDDEAYIAIITQC